MREGFGHPNPWIVDGVMAAAFVLLGLASTTGRGQVPRSFYEPMDALGVALVLAASVPFVFRQHAPLAVLLSTTTAVVVNMSLGHNEGLTPFFIWVAAITVGVMCPLRKTIFGAAYLFAGMLVLLVSDGYGFDAESFVINGALFAAIFMFGINLRARKARIVALEERTEAVEREKEEEARRAVADERLHIARELHDVVAHSMGVIAVQASVGEHVIDDNPAEAKRALEAISGVSRSTLAEIRRMLGVLRDADDDARRGGAEYAPAPGLSELNRLIGEFDGAGLRVALTYDGARQELPRGVDLTAYRIVQEALTNVLKHAGPATATVHVRYEPGALGLEIVDDGRGVNGRSSGRSGHGLVGMRERVAVYDGTLETGPDVGGGFRVAVRLPYEEPV
jgi:signal transduction histidine kinase